MKIGEFNVSNEDPPRLVFKVCSLLKLICKEKYQSLRAVNQELSFCQSKSTEELINCFVDEMNVRDCDFESSTFLDLEDS